MAFPPTCTQVLSLWKTCWNSRSHLWLFVKLPALRGRSCFSERKLSFEVCVGRTPALFLGMLKLSNIWGFLTVGCAGAEGRSCRWMPAGLSLLPSWCEGVPKECVLLLQLLRFTPRSTSMHSKKVSNVSKWGTGNYLYTMCRCFLDFFGDILSVLNSFPPLLPPMLPLAVLSTPLFPPCPWWVPPAPRNWGWQALLWLEGLALAAAQELGWCNLGALQAPDSLQGGNHIPPGEMNWSSLNSRPLSTSFLSTFEF